MSFGRNPFVAKAEAAEIKAESDVDEIARERHFREAAHAWDRAAEREKPGKKREEYLANSERNRALADGDTSEESSPALSPAPTRAEPKTTLGVTAKPPKVLN